MKSLGKDKSLHVFLLISLLGIFLWSFIGCYDFFVWILEAFPAAAAVVILLATYRKFRFTSMAYVLIWIHAVILLVGAHYTYSRMPVFNWLQEAFELSRNHYDRLGHVAQGFIPAIITREVLLRKSVVRKGGWLFSIVISFCMAISAVYELVEWVMAELTGHSATEFLATQGDVWDTQKDMALCLLGAIVALVTLSSLHDRALKRLNY